ncbi:type IV pilus modification PilV family protein [Trichlorobacter lovleyi]|uniref:type IV pilus modification PilV family protein n=1 Tax=Trichlorobacter lovleyi TaxID=313985 RepID=UPI0023F2E33E|nr:prepilin-type N-terminal cleavage/methylation domain-containing protein [Trichlorobacter lovleyi]
MTTPVVSTKSGFTLIEVLVAVVILTVGLLGLMQTVIYAINHNMTNQLRQEAVLVADEAMATEKAKPYSDIAAPDFDSSISTYSALPTVSSSTTINRVFNGVSRSYTVVTTKRAPTAQSKSIEVAASWTYKTKNYNHTISSIVTNISQ